LQAIGKSQENKESPGDCSSGGGKNVLEDDLSDMQDFGFEVIFRASLYPELIFVTRSVVLNYTTH